MKKLQSVITLTLFMAVFLPAVLFAQTQEVPHYYETYEWQSEIISGNGTSERLAQSHIVRADGAPWLRLFFSNVNLGAESRITITSLKDGGRQDLNARTISEWQNSSAYFNGDAVEVRIYAAANAQNIYLEIPQVMVGQWVNDSPSPLSQCGPVDDRTPSNHPASGRIVSIGCTGWIVDNGLHVTAGHCSGGSAAVLQFNVPPSNPNGTINNPDPEDQYSIDPSSKISVNGGVGNDWGVFEVFDNTQTGLQPIDAQGASFTVVQDLSPANIRITGFGVDFNDPTRNQTQQTHVGPNAGSSGTTMRYQTDTEGGNSGSPVIDEATGFAVGVHTHGGCSTGGGGNNSGTSTFNAAFWDALDTTPPPPSDMQVTLSNVNPTTFPPSGGSLSYTAEITNAGGTTETGDIWTMVTLPNGNQFGPTRQFNNVPFTAGQTRTGNITENVPANAPSGTYTYKMNFGTFATNTVVASDEFTFTKTTSPSTAKLSPVAEASATADGDFTDGIAYDWGKLLEEAGIAAIPDAFVLEQNYPNPFNPSTVIRYGLSENTHVKVQIFSVLGKEIATLVDQEQHAGFKSITWNGRNTAGQVVPAGIYLYRIEAAGEVKMKKMIFAK